MKALTASQITKLAIEELTKRGCKVWRNNNLAVRGRTFIGLKGVPDIIGFHKFTGRAIYCEVKTKTDKFSEFQVEFMTEAKESNCHALVATDVDGKLLLSEWKND